MARAAALRLLLWVGQVDSILGSYTISLGKDDVGSFLVAPRDAYTARCRLVPAESADASVCAAVLEDFACLGSVRFPIVEE